MADALHHSMSSAAYFKAGKKEDYLPIHEFMDSSKYFISDWRHRSLLHGTHGIYWYRHFVYGSAALTIGNKDVPVKEVVIRHIIEDMNAVLTPAQWYRELKLETIQGWMTAKGIEWHPLNTLEQAQRSQQKYGGIVEDYLRIHQLLDSPSLWLKGEKQLVLTHNTFGVWLCDQAFGVTFKRRSDRELLLTAAIAKDHIEAELGSVIDVCNFLHLMPIRTWQNGLKPDQVRRIQQLTLEEEHA